ncbi:uncharacterized protein UDID_18181 [Ustilago sp. UG-2017a]|nr:uncharacterized protein UDID_18181 [Ustilago sp. UG-2017a]
MVRKCWWAHARFPRYLPTRPNMTQSELLLGTASNQERVKERGALNLLFLTQAPPKMQIPLLSISDLVAAYPSAFDGQNSVIILENGALIVEWLMNLPPKFPLSIWIRDIRGSEILVKCYDLSVRKTTTLFAELLPFVRHIVLTMTVPAFANLAIVTVGAAVQQTPSARIGTCMDASIAPTRVTSTR